MRRSLIEMPMTDAACPAACRRPLGRRRRRLEVGDALAQHRDEVAHHVGDRVLHAEEVGVEVALGDPVADLAGQPGVELVLGDRLQDGAALVGARVFRVEGHVHRLGGDRDLVDLLPRPLEVRARPAG